MSDTLTLPQSLFMTTLYNQHPCDLNSIFGDHIMAAKSIYLLQQPNHEAPYIKGAIFGDFGGQGNLPHSVGISGVSLTPSGIEYLKAHKLVG